MIDTQRQFMSNYPDHLNDYSEKLKKRNYQQMNKDQVSPVDIQNFTNDQ